MHAGYPNRDRALRHVHRTRATYLYARFPQRHILGMPCCGPGFLTLGKDHDSTCLASAKRLQGAIDQMCGRIRMAYEGGGFPHTYRA
ncbi:hypothetical protein [Streptomyces sp. H27-H5]|uniref:hypothetical protein n=1 Tax=Streptomyces sp. H27-H5 TaxID=2996460 RepID=UPI00226EEDCC|nr:hypothetical protein [Streptomyces sp. H27-H5]MCY0961559.1 hypothetical protein [Streptomyces sp. H27-H5]